MVITYGIPSITLFIEQINISLALCFFFFSKRVKNIFNTIYSYIFIHVHHVAQSSIPKTNRSRYKECISNWSRWRDELNFGFLSGHVSICSSMDPKFKEMFNFYYTAEQLCSNLVSNICLTSIQQGTKMDKIGLQLCFFILNYMAFSYGLLNTFNVTIKWHF